MWGLLTRKTGACLFLLLFSATVRAEIGLYEAVARTLLHNPELIAFGYQLQAQDGRVLQAGLAPNPELSFTVEDALGTGRFSGADSAQTTLSIAWILERGVRQRRLESAREGGIAGFTCDH